MRDVFALKMFVICEEKGHLNFQCGQLKLIKEMIGGEWPAVLWELSQCSQCKSVNAGYECVDRNSAKIESCCGRFP